MDLTISMINFLLHHILWNSTKSWWEGQQQWQVYQTSHCQWSPTQAYSHQCVISSNITAFLDPHFKEIDPFLNEEERMMSRKMRFYILAEDVDLENQSGSGSSEWWLSQWSQSCQAKCKEKGRSSILFVW